MKTTILAATAALFLMACGKSEKKSSTDNRILIKSVFPQVKRLADLDPRQDIYFERIDFDIKKSIKPMKSVRKDAKRMYEYVMDESHTTDRSAWGDTIDYRKYTKRFAIDSILIPQEMEMHISNLLFSEFANKPYFESKFKDPVCNPDSLEKTNWNRISRKLEIFNDSSITKNFYAITQKRHAGIYWLPIGLFLIQNGEQYEWAVIIGWEMKYDNDKDCERLGHITGDIFNFDFSKKKHEFRCE